jgi:cytochrome c oxidase cbb3-type subunit 1
VSVTANNPRLSKFLVVSALSLCIGTLHGMLQVMPPIRRWLDSIGSPYGGPGHMIDPLAHAHMNLVGGVILFVMGATYYLLPIVSARTIFSQRLVDATFWFTALGAYGFYGAQMIFGIWEGSLMQSAPEQIAAVHRYYGPTVAVAGTVMALGFFCYMVNVLSTMLRLGGRRQF